MAVGKLIGTDTAYTINSSPDYIEMTQFTCIASGNVTYFRVYSKVSGSVKIAIYSNNAGEPDVRLGVNNDGVAVIAGQWNVVPIPSTAVVSGTLYWLAVLNNTSGAHVQSADGLGASRVKSSAYASGLPSPAGSGYSAATAIFSLAGWDAIILLPSSISQGILLGTPTVSRVAYITLAAGIQELISVGAPTLQKVSPVVPDLPDWMDSISIVATRLSLPMIIRGTEVNIPIDIKAATIGTIGVNIVAQAIGNLLISVAAQSVGVYLQPEWAAKQSQQKFFRTSSADLATGAYVSSDYTVTTGKTLYITHFSGSIHAKDAADRDKDQVGYWRIENGTTLVVLTDIGGHGGGGMPLPTPVVIPAGEVFRITAFNFANHNCAISIAAGGYEV